ncbi:MAG: hypothetical protein EXS00_07525 [Phycisphaerales bacterium]|nr:hypothetical protein [Phycisphaerales bacterium]
MQADWPSDAAAEVAAIVARSCLPCHTAQGDAPLDLTDSASWWRHCVTISAALEQGAMPPWPIEAGVHFRDTHELPAADRATLLRALQSAHTARTIGEKCTPAAADIKGMPPRSGSASFLVGTDWLTNPEGETRTFAVAINNPTVLLASTITLQPMEPGALASVTVLPDTSGVALRLDASDPAAGYEAMGDIGRSVSGSLGGGGIGCRSLKLPQPFAFRIPPTCALVLEAHAAPLGFAADGALTLTLEFYNSSEPVRVVQPLALGGVPPGAQDELRFEHIMTLSESVDLVAIVPRGGDSVHSMRLDAAAPSESLLILDIPRYLSHFARPYVLTEPLRLSAGTQLTATFSMLPLNLRAPDSMRSAPVLLLLVAPVPAPAIEHQATVTDESK